MSLEYFTIMNKAIVIFACIFSMCVKPPEHVAVSDKSVEAFAQTIKESNLSVLAVGGFYLHSKVEKLYLDLKYKGTLSKDEAKQKLTSYVKGMVEHINHDPALLPHLIKESFDYADISISLGYTSLEGKSSQVHLYNNEIVFSTYHSHNNSLEKDFTEPFFGQEI